MLERRAKEAKSAWVFSSLENALNPLSVFTLEDQHKRAREDAGLTKDFVIHSLRRTYGTRLGEAGADAFTIMRLMGHSTVIVSQRYIHPTPEALERAIKRLDAMNSEAAKRLEKARKRNLLTTVGDGPCAVGGEVLQNQCAGVAELVDARDLKSLVP